VGALLAAGPSLSACGGTSPEVPAPSDGPPAPLGARSRILLIGNSLTSWHELAGMLEDLADDSGLDWEVEAMTVSGGSLSNHWAATTTLPRIRTGNWDAVVLQQGPSALPENREHLRHWTAVFDEEIRAAGARTWLYMVWPGLSREDEFDRVRDSYALAARDVNGGFLPAGETLRRARERTPSAPLYESDGYHPSAEGSYGVALTLFAGLTGRDPLGLPRTLTLESGTRVGVPLSVADLLQRSAAEAVERFAGYQPADVP
jgi:hypothetical protein